MSDQIHCGGCAFWTVERDCVAFGACCRFPRVERKNAADWCGEGKPKPVEPPPAKSEQPKRKGKG